MIQITRRAFCGTGCPRTRLETVSMLDVDDTRAHRCRYTRIHPRARTHMQTHRYNDKLTPFNYLYALMFDLIYSNAQRHITSGTQQAAYNTQKRTCGRQHATQETAHSRTDTGHAQSAGSREQTAGNTQQAAGSRQQAYFTSQHNTTPDTTQKTPCSRQLASDSGHHASANRHQAASIKQQASTIRQLAAYNKHRGTHANWQASVDSI